jgi:hypothetical protein
LKQRHLPVVGIGVLCLAGNVNFMHRVHTKLLLSTLC